MRWVKRVLLGILTLAVLVLAIAGWFWWRTTSEPDFLRGAPTVTPEEARTLVAKLTAEPAAIPTKRPPSEPVPYRLSLGDREIAAVVIAHAPPALAGVVRDFRARIREDDVAFAGTLRESPMEGQTAWIDVTPSAGEGGRLCLAFGRLHLGEAEVPDSLLREMTGGRGIPRRRCVPAHGLLPGPLTSVEIAGGRVELRGYTGGP